MEPNSPKKIQFSVPLFQSQLDPQASEHIRKRRPTPATLVIYNDPNTSDDKLTPSGQGEQTPGTQQLSPAQRKQSVYTPPTMRELQLVVEQHFQRQEQQQQDGGGGALSSDSPDTPSPVTAPQQRHAHGHGHGHAHAAMPTAPPWQNHNYPEPNGNDRSSSNSNSSSSQSIGTLGSPVSCTSSSSSSTAVGGESPEASECPQKNLSSPSTISR